jgi:hypothetical protein
VSFVCALVVAVAGVVSAVSGDYGGALGCLLVVLLLLGMARLDRQITAVGTRFFQRIERSRLARLAFFSLAATLLAMVLGGVWVSASEQDGRWRYPIAAAVTVLFLTGLALPRLLGRRNGRNG